jgi:putative FmdB family regulatory protein
MPTYEYRCDKCGHQFEQFQSITARPLRKCPACRTNGLKRLIGSGGGIIFKGSGFYQTDYRSESYKKGQKSEKEKTTPAEKKTEKKPTEKAEKTTKDKKKTA